MFDYALRWCECIMNFWLVFVKIKPKTSHVIPKASGRVTPHSS
jgi:hypothetical protein